MAFQTVLRANELWDGDMRVVVVAAKRLVLIRQGTAISAFEDRCAHLGVPISQGRIDRGVITCSAHHWQYDVATGTGVNPRNAQLCRFPARLHNGEVQVDVDGTT